MIVHCNSALCSDEESCNVHEKSRGARGAITHVAMKMKWNEKKKQGSISDNSQFSTEKP